MTAITDSEIQEITDWIADHLNSAEQRDGYRFPVEAISLGDGTRLSVQVGEYLYCRPRNNQGPWTHVEVMPVTPGFKPIHMADYVSDSVYAQIPIEDLAKEIIERGRM